MLKTVRTTTVIALLGAVSAPCAEAQSHGRRCAVDDTIVYSFTTPSGPDSLQVDFDLYFNNDSSAFVLLVLDGDNDTVLSTASGISRGDRFVHGSARLFPDRLYRIGVACINVSADYRLAVRSGDEMRLASPVVALDHQGLTAGEAVEMFEVERRVQAAAARLRR